MVLINKAAGGNQSKNAAPDAQRLRDAFRRHGIEPELRFASAAEHMDHARSLARSGADLLVAGGGDGTVSSLAGVLAGGDVPLGILPLGTFNHFAQDLGIPLDLDRAVETIGRRHVVRVDVGDVNGRTFINNSSIGIYPRAVEERERHRKRFGGSKRVAMVVASLKFFRQFPLLQVRIEAGEGVWHRLTPFVFVGNNEYALNLFEVQRRPQLTGGKLCLCVTTCQGMGCLLKLLWLSLHRRLDQASEVDIHLASELRVHVHRRSIKVAVDGEVLRLQPPLRYCVHRAALPVIVPGAVS